MKRHYAKQFQVIKDAAALALEQKSFFALSVFLFLTGISAGVFLELIMNPEEKSKVILYLQQYLSFGNPAVDYPSPFFASASSNLFLLFILLLCGLTVLGFPAALAVLLFKGLSLGFSAGLILESQSGSGPFLILTSLVPQNCFLIPAFILAVSGVLNYSFARIHSNKQPKRNSRKNSPGLLLILMLLLAVIIVLGCSIEAILYAVVLLP